MRYAARYALFGILGWEINLASSLTSLPWSSGIGPLVMLIRRKRHRIQWSMRIGSRQKLPVPMFDLPTRRLRCSQHAECLIQISFLVSGHGSGRHASRVFGTNTTSWYIPPLALVSMRLTEVLYGRISCGSQQYYSIGEDGCPLDFFFFLFGTVQTWKISRARGCVLLGPNAFLSYNGASS
jgi:hypothetical protein